MNRVFKTKWSVAHQGYVVTDEHHASKTKANKSVVALAVASMMMLAGSASAAYFEPGFLATSSGDVTASQKSWETQEYNNAWGLKSMNASSAYALGYHGQGVKLGVMDSGALLSHPDFAGGRLSATHVKGEYSQTGDRYPQNGPNGKDTGHYEAGESFDVTGDFMLGKNDSHGTKVSGTMGSDRNGVGSHGVAWGAEIISGNTGGSDSTNYGPFLDYKFFKDGYDALVKSGVKIINNSFGTNVKQYVIGADGKPKFEPYSVSGIELTTVQDIEYEYFLFKAKYGEKKSFVDAAWEAVNGKDVIQVFTNGNNNRANPYHRALYPYFNPEAEAQWIAIAGLEQKKGEPDQYQIKDSFNEAGYAKYWTLAAAGANGYTTAVDPKTGKPTAAAKHFEDGFSSFSGTSMAAPFVSGAFGVLASRYTEMDAKQVREVLLTTANHKQADGVTDIDGWANVKGDTPKEGEVSDRMGWGVPDLKKGMYGLGQMLGKFDYNMSAGSLDVWSNDISQVALEQREREDIAWLKSVTADGTVDGKVLASKGGDYKLENDKLIAGLEDVQKIDPAKAEEWRQAYFDKRAEVIRDKIKNGLYDGSLVKRGEGTLVMTGDNSYKGTTTVEGGKLLAFAESIGSDEVSVNGGAFGVLSAYDDQFTKKGVLTSKEADAGKLTIKVGAQGALYVDAASKVTVKAVDLTSKKVVVGLAGADRDTLVAAYKGTRAEVSGSFTVKEGQDVFKDATITKDKTESAFFDVKDPTLSADNKTINVSMTKKDDVTFATFAKGGNQQSIAQAIEGSNNTLMSDLLTKDAATITNTYAAIDDDFYVTARNGLVMNATAMSRAVVDQAQGMGAGRTAEFDEGRAHVWATGMGLWGSADGNTASLDNDFTLGMVGAEFNVAPSTKVGAFFGYGSTKLSGAQGSIKGDDKHYGIYGLTDYGNMSFTYGLAYTDQNRDTSRIYAHEGNTHSENASVLQGFAEAGYNFDVASAKVTPYAGLTWARVETDAVVDHALGHAFKTEGIKDDIQIATVGVRTALPFNWGTLPVSVKADAGWSHFLGDNEGAVKVQMGADGQFATIEGSDLKDQFNLGLGLVGQVSKNATVGVNYVGAWGSDIDTHGITANLRINF